MSKRHEGLWFSCERIGVRDEAGFPIGFVNGRREDSSQKMIYTFNANRCEPQLKAGELRTIADKLDELNKESQDG